MALVEFGAEHAQKAELAFDHRARPGEAGGSKARRQHPGFRGAPEMQPLDGAAVAAREFEKAAGERPGDADRVGHLRRIETEQMAGGHRGAERSGRARRVKAARLVGVAGRAADPDHDLVGRDKRRDQGLAAPALLLRDGERRREHGRAGMRAGAGPGQAVELEGMRQRAIGERRRRRLHLLRPGRECGSCRRGRCARHRR